MKNKFWIGIAVITCVSFGAYFSAPITSISKDIIALPGVAALISALYQLARDHASHQRNIELQQKQNLFNLGATSHMANTVFDKHVEFCEKYLREVTETVVTLTREGPTQNALDHAGRLYSLRVEYTAWITEEIDNNLLPFEKAVRSIGAKEHLVDQIQDVEGKDQLRSQALDEIHNTFSNLMGFTTHGEVDENATVIAVKERVRNILGVNDLVQIRTYLIDQASTVTSS